ncbi:hypothetical protein [Micromonospora chersina]|uniref:hypothetical protein n=1 Tax=Micromonospora chersina TaxID=47854 RepID=UPI003D9241AE
MTTNTSRAARPSAFYRNDEPVVQSHPMLPGAVAPRFGDTHCWDLNGVVYKAPSHASAAIRVLFRDLDLTWNLMARELAMLWLNPRHPAILAAGVHLRADPLAVMTVAQRVGHLRPLAAFGAARGLPSNLQAWSSEDFKAYIAHRQTITEPGSVTNHVHLIKALHQLRAALTCGGLPYDPWPGMSTNYVANQPIVPELRTPVIPPETWFPLVRNCWTYIDVFAPDILRAAAYWDDLRSRPLTGPDAARRFDTWLMDPANTMPTRRAGPSETPGPKINISVLTRVIGVRPDFFQSSTPHGRQRREALERLVVNGRSHPGLLPNLAEVGRPDGSHGPWHDSLGPTELQVEQVMLRNACFVFTAALSMMRECELRAITKDALVEHYGSPAVKSTKQKLDPNLPIKHWWITPPVARAIELAGRLSQHDHLTFAAVSDRWAGDSFTSIAAIDDFVRHINRWRHVSGLEEIPDSNITPHMFRRTMAMLSRDFPGAEIAVGMQLKHVTTRALANRVTGAYMDNDPS